VQVGFESFGTDLPEDVSQEELLKVVAAYNADPKVRVPTHLVKQSAAFLVAKHRQQSQQP
jgi:5,10-methylene-tetrahydrofolate dehydrogenase/methenyl tetrahydrofolate cyclohydrolase